MTLGRFWGSFCRRKRITAHPWLSPPKRFVTFERSQGECWRMPYTIYFNGPILTMDPVNPLAGALATDEHRVLYAGHLDGAYQSLPGGEKPRLIDLDGRVLLPGFIDAHAHLALFATELSGIPLKPLRSIKEITRALYKKVQTTPPGEWIRGGGYNDFYLAERRHPTRHDLDHIAPNHPVVLTRTCAHIAVANTMALKLAGIDLHAGDPSGGHYGRDSDSNTLNGVLYDQALNRIQDASRLSPQEMTRYLSLASETWLKAGVTAIHDAGGPPEYFPVLIQAFRDGLIRQRVDAMVWNGLGINQLSSFLPSGICTGFHLQDLYIGAAKVMVDGSSSGPTAATREPYASDGLSQGILYHSQGELDQLIREAARRGFQVTTHAVGDQAVANSIRSIAQYGDSTRRNRIEHCAMCPHDLIADLVTWGITPVGQPHFLFEFGDGYIENYGTERGSHMFPFRSWLNAGLLPAGSSDSPVTNFRPLSGIGSAVFRQTQAGQVLAPEERLSVEEALTLYTINAARLAFAENEMGILKAGYRANFVILGEDIRRMSVFEDIRDCPVDATIVGGEIGWHRTSFPG